MNDHQFQVYLSTLIAIIGVAGIIIGALLTFASDYIIKKREVKLKVFEKIFDKRIEAHQDILSIVQMMRMVLGVNKVDNEGNAISYPFIIDSKQNLSDFMNSFTSIVNPNSFWLNIELFRLINYIQDYITGLQMNLTNIDDKFYPEIGIYIKSDIISLAKELEEEVFKFFQKDVYTVNINISKGHHKFPKEITHKRWEASKLSLIQNELSAIRRGENVDLSSLKNT